MPKKQPPSRPAEPIPSPWPHRLAWALACAVFGLIVLGGLVTTYDAGTSVPDWPTTYGRWFYPVGPWLGGSWDFKLAYGERLLALGVILLAVALLAAVWRGDPRRWMRWPAAAVLLALLLQAALGGLRVVFDERLLAKILGCTAPLCFALCAAMVTLTSRAGAGGWGLGPGERAASPQPSAPSRAKAFSLLAATAIYAEIVVGAQLRHPIPGAWPRWSEVWVWTKVVVAALLAANVVGLLVGLRGTPSRCGRLAKLLAGLFLAQLVLAAATWVTNYGWPAWFRNYVWALPYAVAAEGWLQVTCTTLHAALGPLLLATASTLVLWSYRRSRPTAG